MTVSVVLDSAGRRPFAGNDAWLPRRTIASQQRMRYPADPPTVEEIVGVIRQVEVIATALACAP